LITLRILVLVLALPFIVGLSQPSAEETVIVSKAFNGREIKVRAGSLIRVDLEELGSAGYAWAIQNLDTHHFDIVSVQTEASPPPGDVTGKPVIKAWLIRATKTGKGELKFLQYRTWEGEKSAVDTFVLKVRIL
jgi:predicted secreted protein